MDSASFILVHYPAASCHQNEQQDMLEGTRIAITVSSLGPQRGLSHLADVSLQYVWSPVSTNLKICYWLHTWLYPFNSQVNLMFGFAKKCVSEQTIELVLYCYNNTEVTFFFFFFSHPFCGE